jgi:hypothetical protein
MRLFKMSRVKSLGLKAKYKEWGYLVRYVRFFLHRSTTQSVFTKLHKERIMNAGFRKNRERYCDPVS